MLTLFGDHQSRFCDGRFRRSFLRRERLGLGGLTPDTSVIFVELVGGPTQVATNDPNPLAPRERIREII